MACPRCHNPFEDPLHAVKNCPIAKNTLRECGFRQDLTDFETDDPISWLEKGSKVLSKKDFDLLLTAIWVIWSARKTQIHKGIIDSDVRLAVKTKMYFDEYNAAQEKHDDRKGKATESQMALWKAPEEGWYKVNFDASFDAGSKSGGVGVVIRDFEGFVMASAAVKIPRVLDATMEEAMAAMVAMQFTRSYGFSKIILEGDALSAIKEIRSKDVCCTRFGPLTDECKKLTDQCEEFKATFTKREGNQLVDALAKLSYSFNGDVFWREEYSFDVHRIVMHDAINI